MTGQRFTKSARQVLAQLEKLSEFASAQEIHTQLRNQNETIGLTSVYRALQQLSAAGEVDVLRKNDGEALYRKCNTGHHHHLVCKECGKTIEVEGAGVEDWARAVAERYGFKETQHNAEIFGTCKDCDI